MVYCWFEFGFGFCVKRFRIVSCVLLLGFIWFVYFFVGWWFVSVW